MPEPALWAGIEGLETDIWVLYGVELGALVWTHRNLAIPLKQSQTKQLLMPI